MRMHYKYNKARTGLLLTIIFLLLLITGCDTVTDSNPIHDLNSLKVLNMYASKEEMENVYNNRFTDLEILVHIEHEGSRYKGYMEPSGAGSRYFPKYSYSIEELDGTINDLNTFSISAQVYDRTMIKNTIAKYLYERTGFPVFYTEPIFATMNSENLGLYAFNERIDEVYFAKREISVYELYQVQFDAKFTFTRRNNVKENFDKEIPDDENYENLEIMIDKIDKVDPANIFTELNKYLDVKEYLRYHAITSVRHDPDAFTNNFFLYKESPLASFRVIPWDFDKTFDIVGSVGFYGHNQIIEKLFQNDSCRVLYKEYMNDILNNIFTESNLYPIIDQLAEKIKPYYRYDPYLGARNFDEEVKFLKDFITGRREYLLGELERFK